MKTLKFRRVCTDILQTLRDDRSQPILLFSTILSITITEENKIFHDEVKFEQYLFTNLAPQKVLQEKFISKEVNYRHENTGKT